MNQALLDGCFRVAGRTTWYLQPDEIQRDLDAFLDQYNLRRSHRGYRLGGRTPAQALQEALGVTELPSLVGGFLVRRSVRSRLEAAQRTGARRRTSRLHPRLGGP